MNSENDLPHAHRHLPQLVVIQSKTKLPKACCVLTAELTRQLLGTMPAPVAEPAKLAYDMKMSLEAVNRFWLESAMKTFATKKEVAHALGISIKTLYTRLHLYGLFEQYEKQVDPTKPTT